MVQKYINQRHSHSFTLFPIRLTSIVKTHKYNKIAVILENIDNIIELKSVDKVIATIYDQR